MLVYHRKDRELNYLSSVMRFLGSDDYTHVAAFAMGAFSIVAFRWCLQWYRRLKLLPLVDGAYQKLRMVCEPKTLNPEYPGNPDYMRADARDTVNPLIPHLKRVGFYPPVECTTDDASLNAWFRFLSHVRTDLSAAKVFPGTR